MLYVQSDSTDPCYNLALEEYLFSHLADRQNCFMLWQNNKAVIVGKYQNTIAEINASYVESNHLKVVRRLSGGGAVYHDLGNVNFTFVENRQEGEAFDFAVFCRPIANALARLGVEVQISGRNDMTVQGKKFSGNAQYMKRGRVMHHGTIMFDSDLDAVESALSPSGEKLESKGHKSVRSRVTNLKPFIKKEINVTEFRDILRDYVAAAHPLQTYSLNADDRAAVETLRDRVYSQWSWNYGFSPVYTHYKSRYIGGCGKIDIYLDIAESGVIHEVAFYGDFFSSDNPQVLSEKLKGCFLEREALSRVLEGVSIGMFFHNLSTEDFLNALLL